MARADATTVSGIAERCQRMLARHMLDIHGRTDRMFAWLMLGQWAFAVLISLVVSPYTWAGMTRSVHAHVYAAVLLGGVLCSLPVPLALWRPGWVLTRHVIAVAQMLWSALLIHLTGGRIETHFHVFGSLAFLSFYRDYRVLLTASVIVAADHFVRGLYWPESVYGVSGVQGWRFLEHAGWVVFTDLFLVLACLRGVAELRALKEQQARVEALSACVAHELRNPLAAVRNAVAYIAKKIGRAGPGTDLRADARVQEFTALIDRELTVCGKIISDLLDFARERQPARAPCPLRPLASEAIGLVPQRPGVEVANDVPDDLPVPSLDRDQFRQVLVNLVQNAVEAVPPERSGKVAVSAAGGGDRPWCISVSDDGQGIPGQTLSRIFEPLFSTKVKGTGLGLAIVANMVDRHQGTIRAESEPGHGTCFTIQLPADALSRAA